MQTKTQLSATGHRRQVREAGVREVERQGYGERADLMLCLMLQVYLNRSHSWDASSKEGLHSLIPAVWGWFGTVEAVLSDKVDQSRLELLYRINGT